MNRRALLFASLFLFQTLALPKAALTFQADLAPGAAMQRPLGAGEVEAYTLRLGPKEFVRLRLVPSRIDVIVAFSGPNGTKIAEFENAKSPPGPVMISAVTETAGVYRIQIRCANKDGAGEYRIQFLEQRAAAAPDSDTVSADRLFTEAEHSRSEGNAQSLRQSLAKYEAALKLYQSTQDSLGQALSLTGLARTYDVLAEKQKALGLYNQALALYRKHEDRSREAYLLGFIALIHDHQGDRTQALSLANQALSASMAAQDTRAQGISLNNLALIYDNLGERQKALDHYSRALPLHRIAGNRRAEGTTLLNIGVVYDKLGDKQRALDSLNQGLEIRRAIGDPRDLAAALNNLGALHFSIDDYPRALDFYNQALKSWRTSGDPSGEAATLHNIAHIYDLTGEYQKSLDVYSEALRLHRSSGFRVGEANTLTNMGRLYSRVGENRKALDLYSESLALHQATGNKSSEAAVLTNIAGIQERSGDRAKALENLDLALNLRRNLRDPGGEASALNSIARIYASQGQIDRALELQRKALELHRSVNSRRGVALTLTSIGLIYALKGDVKDAIEYHRQALELFRAMGQPVAEATTLYSLAQAENQAGNLLEARERIESGLKIIESIRTRVAAQELRTSYSASIQNYYDFYVSLLMALHQKFPDRGFDAAALQASERARARTLLEILNEANADIRQGVDPALLARERQVQQLLNSKAEKQARLFSASQGGGQAAALAKEIDIIAEDYASLRTEIRQSSPRYAALTQPEPLDLDRIQRQVLDEDSILLEYSLEGARSFVWAVTSGGITAFVLPARSEIEDLASRYYRACRENQVDQIDEAGRLLSRAILQPVARMLGTKRLLIVADGALQYVPFAALPVPGTQAFRPLILEHEVVMLPSASTVAILRRDFGARKPAPKTLAVFADPVFSAEDARVKLPGRDGRPAPNAGTSGRAAKDLPLTAPDPPTRSGASDLLPGRSGGDLPTRFSRLIGTRREAAAILKLTAPADRRQALDFQASRAMATSRELEQYRIIHFATHGLLDSSHPELSGVVLSLVDENGNPQDGFLRLNHIYNLKLPAELVVLSACQTALGKEIRGEGLISLTRGFMYAGAPRLVASLWKVDDRATSDLMAQFYQSMLGPRRLRPSAALRAAQISIYQQKTRSSPYYWSAFVFQGEWR
ncbi:MAG TPA: CHAT domain-containing protein [Acidobacteriota bacterium]